MGFVAAFWWVREAGLLRADSTSQTGLSPLDTYLETDKDTRVMAQRRTRDIAIGELSVGTWTVSLVAACKSVSS